MNGRTRTAPFRASLFRECGAASAPPSRAPIGLKERSLAPAARAELFHVKEFRIDQLTKLVDLARRCPEAVAAPARDPEDASEEEPDRVREELAEGFARYCERRARPPPWPWPAASP